MNCCDIERFVDPYLDGEFDERERTEIELHVAACSACRQLVELQQSLRRVVATCGHTCAPPALHDRILAQLRLDEVDALDEHCAAPPVDPAPMPAGVWHEWRGWRYVSLAAAATVLLGLTTLGLMNGGTNGGARYVGNLNGTVDTSLDDAGSTDRIVEETLDWHRRRLPMEVTGPSSDEVRGWFQGKVDFPVRLPAFDERNVAVLGGRLAKVGDHKAALVTLEVNHRKMSMMVFPQDSLLRGPQRFAHPLVRRSELPRVMLRSASGYNVAIVRDGDIAYSFVSDLPKPELRQLVSGARIR